MCWEKYGRPSDDSNKKKRKKKQSILNLMSSVNHFNFMELGCADLCRALEVVSMHAAQRNGGKVANVTRGPQFWRQ